MAELERTGAWQRDFRLLWSGSAISQLGSVSATVTAPLLALSLTGSPVFAGWVTAAGTLPRILLHLPVGVLIDHSDRRRVLIVTMTARLVLAASVVAAMLTTELTVFLLPAIAVLQGVCLVVCGTAETTLIPRLVPGERLPGAMARNEGRVHGAGLLGRPLGGLLYDLHHALPFLMETLTSCLSVVAFAKMRKEPAEPAGRRQALRMAGRAQELRAGLRFLGEDRLLLSVLVVCALANFCFQTLGLVLVMVAHQQQLSMFVIGCLIAASGFGGVVGAFTAPRLLRRQKDQRKMIVQSVWSWMALSLVLALMEPGTLFYAVFALPLVWGGIGFTGAHLNVALALYQAERVPQHLYGRVTGAGRFLSGSAVPLGALASGYVIAELGTQDAVILVAVVVAALAVAITIMAPRPVERCTRVRAALAWVARGGRG
ncbi:Predicted arabinose efflux permease, MFS family [Nonomuraea solani]|uniref:Predicted arabinose efflux permease, MFS family n=1 Tax=Nonomuraea solani TaxID=1144553 RepID=A0A1H6EWE1_9ACTN|nr:MFS transporter [Nonomuraea solani]SEH01235.1 Predicted arabinose efflux permease, MFS family [Nonomuraea solani]